MVESYVLGICEELKKVLPENTKTNETEENVVLSFCLESGVKGIDVNIELSNKIIKAKGTREYEYPISEKAANEFQYTISETYPGYAIYTTGQSFAVSKFVYYQSTSEAMDEINAILNVMKDAVSKFETQCVNFNNAKAVVEEDEYGDYDDYDPEENVKVIDVNNNYHVVSTTELDNDVYDESHKEFAEKTFNKIAEMFGIKRNGNEIVFKDSHSEQIVTCLLIPLDAEILIKVTVNVPRDIGMIYQTFINTSYPELRSSYNAETEEFSVKRYSTPDEYAPDETFEYIELCRTAMSECVKEYEQNLNKKESSEFISDVQQILSEQTESVSEREKAVAAREEEINKYEEQLKEKEKEFERKLQELEEEKAAMLEESEKEKRRLAEYEEEMQEKIKVYEERNTKDILNIQQLAAQLAKLQQRQSVSGMDEDAEEEIFRLKSKINQMTKQKIALEKKLTEKIDERNSKIKELSDELNKKNLDLKDVESGIEDRIKAKVAEEVKAAEEKIKGLETQLSEIGHILTPDEMLEYYKDFDFDAKKRHAANAEFIVYNDEALEIKIRFGDVNYVDVSRVASMKDVMLRKFNSKFVNVKFFSKDDKIIARAYFKNNATVEEVDELVTSLASRFSK